MPHLNFLASKKPSAHKIFTGPRDWKGTRRRQIWFVRNDRSYDAQQTDRKYKKTRPKAGKWWVQRKRILHRSQKLHQEHAGPKPHAPTTSPSECEEQAGGTPPAFLITGQSWSGMYPPDARQQAGRDILEKHTGKLAGRVRERENQRVVRPGSRILALGKYSQ